MPVFRGKTVFLSINKTKSKKKNKKNKNKSKTRTNTKNNPTTKQKQRKQNKTKATQKTKTNTRNTKTPKPSKPKINKNKPPHKSPQNWEKKTKHFNTSGTMPNTPKTNHTNIKTSKNKPKKHHFAMFKNNPPFFINFLFFQHTVFAFEKLCFAENTIKIVFSAKHSFSKTQLVKPTFSAMSKKHLFQRKGVIFGLGNFRWNHYFYSFSWFALFWSKKILVKTGSVHENARFFSLPDTNNVRQFLLKIQFFCFFTFLDDHLKKPLFIGFFLPFPFCLFFFFLFLFLQHKKDKNKKMQFSFRKPHFWHPQKFCKNTSLAQCDTICVFKNTPKTKTVKNLDQFLTLNLDQF